MAIVELKNVHKKYPLGKTEVHAVQGVSFEITKGDFVSIAGPSGSGKSTTLNLRITSYNVCYTKLLRWIFLVNVF